MTDLHTMPWSAHAASVPPDSPTLEHVPRAPSQRPLQPQQCLPRQLPTLEQLPVNRPLPDALPPAEWSGMINRIRLEMSLAR